MALLTHDRAETGPHGSVLRGSLADLLVQAHLAAEPCGLGLHGPRFWASVVVRGKQVLHVEGVTGLLGPLEAELPDPSALRGSLPHDVNVAIAAGFAPERILDAASLGLGLFLASLVDRTDVHVHLQPHRAPPPGAFPLPEPLLRLFSRGLRELRSPAQVASGLRAFWDAPLRLGRFGEQDLPDLDPIALRTLHLVRPGMTLGELVTLSGRHQQERTAWAWRSVDLLLQLGVLGLGGHSALDPLSVPRFRDEAPALRAQVTDTPPPPRVAEPPPKAEEPKAAEPKAAEPKAAEPKAAEPRHADPAAEPPEDPRPPPLPSDQDVLALVTRCSELNPLAVLNLRGNALFDVFTLAGLQAAFQREATRFRPEVFAQGNVNTLDAVSALDEIFRSSREALRDPAIAALWLRELRAFAEAPPPLSEDDSTRARELFERAQTHTARREWLEAHHLALEALRLDPRQTRTRILDIFCRVALRLISPLDGVLNLDALWLGDPKDHALALVTAGRLLKAAGRRSQALARFRAALELDPERADARREVEAEERAGPG